MSAYRHAQSTAPGPDASERRLDSWKEIARYLNRHVTTVRRWERTEGLPVHRHLHGRLGSIYAYVSEVDAWFESRRRDGLFGEPAPVDVHAVPPSTVDDPSGDCGEDPSHEPLPSRPLCLPVAAAGPVPRLGFLRRGLARLRCHHVGAALALPAVALVAWTEVASLPVDGLRGTLGARQSTSAVFSSRALDRHPDDDRGVKPGIAASIAAAGRAPGAGLSRLEATKGDSEFHNLEAQFFLNRRRPGYLERAEASYRRALQEQPGDAKAWAGLAGVYNLAYYEPDHLGLTRATLLEMQRKAVERALLLDPSLAEAHVRRAQVLAVTGDFANARQEIEEAQRVDPHSPLLLSFLAGKAFQHGEPAAAVDLQRRAAMRDPLALAWRANLGLYLLAAGRLEESAVELRTVLQVAGPPAASSDEIAIGAASNLATVLIAERRFDEAAALVRSLPAGPQRDRGLALVERGLGHEAEANAALRRLSATADAESWAWIAEAYAYRGDVEQAFKWLAAATKQGKRSGDSLQPWKLDLRYSPLLDALRRDARWNAWLAENSTHG